VSCKDDNQKRDADNEKDAKKKVIFSNINKDGFYDTPINETAEATVTTWTELRLFIEFETKQNHWCFPAKSTAISKKNNGVDDKYSSSI
jgi:hypothetical protein